MLSKLADTHSIMLPAAELKCVKCPAFYCTDSDCLHSEAEAIEPCVARLSEGITRSKQQYLAVQLRQSLLPASQDGGTKMICCRGGESNDTIGNLRPYLPGLPIHSNCPKSYLVRQDHVTYPHTMWKLDIRGSGTDCW